MTVALADTSVLLGGGALKTGETPALSVVSIGELELGVLAAGGEPLRAERLRRLSALVASTPVLPIDRPVATRYAEIRALTGRQPSNDLWIAATALAHDLILVTADERQAKLPLVKTRLVA